jgi:hypothetical protein
LDDIQLKKLEGIWKEEVIELLKVLSGYMLVVAGKNHENS